ncbi:MAG: hypothetical protein AAGI45_08195 [Cyanobacteria bacterium P01_H01_bin.26]
MESCVVSDLKVHSQHNCYRLSPEQMTAIQDKGVSVTLSPGTNIVKIRETTESNRLAPSVLLWIYGGKVVNKKTNVEVVATWSSLTGYDDALVMDVIEPATLCAFFFSTPGDDSSGDSDDGELILSVVTI